MHRVQVVLSTVPNERVDSALTLLPPNYGRQSRFLFFVSTGVSHHDPSVPMLPKIRALEKDPDRPFWIYRRLDPE